jgi:hypothetical protein
MYGRMIESSEFPVEEMILAAIVVSSIPEYPDSLSK